MDTASPHQCDGMLAALTRSDVPVHYSDRMREWGLEYQDGGSSIQLLEFCPFCGTELPQSARYEWFDRLRAMGLEPNDDDAIPTEMQSGAWWRAAEARGENVTREDES